ncbi:hypothetical protein FHN55_08385 [Streptomyces sp. NP160]|uniref:hypothetical protein n=1 Tax=Streptomyces sp. NP160 TaxID=2586637 RepID=UPI0011190273|nr:hypothetical protein [Streptomyces sp. NP160]TNM68033.1 hypothetical protein FHN55_08385 [Streptomyces sp. NP160]
MRRGGAPVRREGADRGSGSVLVLAAAAGALVLAAAAAAAGQVGAAAARAGSVADAAALAAAAASAVGESGCGRAGRVARAGGGELVACAEVTGPSAGAASGALPGAGGQGGGPLVDVEVAVRPPGLAGALGPVTSRARAGQAP